MLGVHFLGNGKLSLDEMSIPEPKGQDVLIKIKAAAVCGTDRENLVGGGQPKIPGHESAGEVVAIDKSSRLKPGDRVAVNCHITCGGCEHCIRGDLYFCKDLLIVGFDIDGGFAEYALIPEKCCMVLPDDISFEEGSLMVDMLGTSYRAVKRANLSPGDQVAIWGAGPIGLSALLVAKWLGAEPIIVDFNEYRLGMAKSLGAALTVNSKKDDVAEKIWHFTNRRGVDVAFECVGSEQAASQALPLIRKRGKMAFVGVSDHFVVNPWEDLIQRELTIYGSRCFVVPEFDELSSMVRRGLPVTDIVTHRFPIAEAEEGFNTYLSTECGKVVFTG
jgi:threonine dehydrogenase-like Zn-dependent dehydrogenase